MEKLMYAFAGLSAGFMSLVLFSSFYAEDSKSAQNTSENVEHIVDRTPLNLTGIEANKIYAFAGEDVPMDNFDVAERLDRESLINTYLQSANILNLKIANRYFPMIESILAKYGIPEDFKYLSVAESNLRMATSSAGAKGIWQFMESSGEGYGLEVNGEIDERFHPEKSTEAACKFILDLKERFGSWTLAAAAYNMGGAGLAKQIKDQQVDNFYDLQLNAETSRYIFRIIAIKEIMMHPAKYGVDLEETQRYPPLNDFYTVPVTGPVPSLTALAKQNGTTYRMLKVFNPWLISSQITNRYGKSYEIKFPTQH